MGKKLGIQFGAPVFFTGIWESVCSGLKPCDSLQIWRHQEYYEFLIGLCSRDSPLSLEPAKAIPWFRSFRKILLQCFKSLSQLKHIFINTVLSSLKMKTYFPLTLSSTSFWFYHTFSWKITSSYKTGCLLSLPELTLLCHDLGLSRWPWFWSRSLELLHVTLDASGTRDFKSFPFLEQWRQSSHSDCFFECPKSHIPFVRANRTTG